MELRLIALQHELSDEYLELCMIHQELSADSFIYFPIYEDRLQVAKINLAMMLPVTEG